MEMLSSTDRGNVPHEVLVRFVREGHRIENDIVPRSIVGTIPRTGSPVVNPIATFTDQLRRSRPCIETLTFRVEGSVLELKEEILWAILDSQLRQLSWS